MTPEVSHDAHQLKCLSAVPSSLTVSDGQDCQQPGHELHVDPRALGTSYSVQGVVHTLWLCNHVWELRQLHFPA